MLTLTFPGITNWFIKVMLGCYILFFIIYFILPYKTVFKNAILLITVVMTIIAFISLEMSSIWWSSVLLFPLGVYYAHYKEKLGKLLDKWYIFAAAFILFAAIHILTVKVSRYFEITSCVFAVTSFLCINKKITLNSKIFQFIGKFSYEIYLIHTGLLASVYNAESLRNLEVLIIYCVTLIGGYILHQLASKFLNWSIKR